MIASENNGLAQSFDLTALSAPCVCVIREMLQCGLIDETLMKCCTVLRLLSSSVSVASSRCWTSINCSLTVLRHFTVQLSTLFNSIFMYFVDIINAQLDEHDYIMHMLLHMHDVITSCICCVTQTLIINIFRRIHSNCFFGMTYC